MAAQKILIVYYLRSGTTRRVAEALAAELKCDAEEIGDVKSRTGFLGIIGSVIEAVAQRPAPIAPAKLNPSSYDLVVVGTPVWAWSVASPVRTYLNHRLHVLAGCRRLGAHFTPSGLAGRPTGNRAAQS